MALPDSEERAEKMPTLRTLLNDINSVYMVDTKEVDIMIKNVPKAERMLRVALGILFGLLACLVNGWPGCGLELVHAS